MSNEEQAALKDKLQRILKASPQLRSCRIEVTVTNAGVTLNGNANSFYAKQIAQETVRGHLRGLELRNFLEVTG